MTEEEQFLLDSLDIATRLSPRSLDPRFLANWASILIDKGFTGSEVSTLWLDGASRYPDELQVLVEKVLEEIGLEVILPERDRNLFGNFLAVKRMLAEEPLRPDAVLYLPSNDFADKRLESILNLTLEVDIALNEPSYSGLPSDKTEFETALRTTCEAWIDQVLPDVAVVLSEVDCVLNCPR